MSVTLYTMQAEKNKAWRDRFTQPLQTRGHIKMKR